MTDQRFAQVSTISILLGLVVGVSILTKQSIYLVCLSPTWQPLTQIRLLVVVLYTGLAVLSLAGILPYLTLLRATGRTRHEQQVLLLCSFLFSIAPSACGLLFTALTGELLWGFTFAILAMTQALFLVCICHRNSSRPHISRLPQPPNHSSGLDK